MVVAAPVVVRRQVLVVVQTQWGAPAAVHKKQEKLKNIKMKKEQMTNLLKNAKNDDK